MKLFPLIVCFAALCCCMAKKACKTADVPDSMPTAVPLPDGTFLPVLMTHVKEPKKVDKAVAIVHGVGRNYNDFYRWAMDAAANGKQEFSTVVAAVWFADTSCTRADWTGDNKATGNMASWSEKTAQWVAGQSSDLGNTGVTSYEAYDTLLKWLPTQFPGVKKVTATGYSAGAQFGSRWTFMSPEGARGKTTTGVPLQMIWGDSSSYLWLDNRRPAPSCAKSLDTPTSFKCDKFEVPGVPPVGPRQYIRYPEQSCKGSGKDALRDYQGSSSTCKQKCDALNCPGFMRQKGKCYFRSGELQTPYSKSGSSCYRPKEVSIDTCDGKFDDYYYGFSKLGMTAHTKAQKSVTAYLKKFTKSVGPKDIGYRFTTKDVHFVFGIDDNRACGTDLEKCSARCAYQITGTNRLARGLNYMGYLKMYFAKYGYKPSYSFVNGGHQAQQMTAGEQWNKKVLGTGQYTPCWDNGQAWKVWCWKGKYVKKFIEQELQQQEGQSQGDATFASITVLGLLSCLVCCCCALLASILRRSRSKSSRNIQQSQDVELLVAE